LLRDQVLPVPDLLDADLKEALMVALKELVAISNGAACTSQNYTASHVLKAMELPEDHVRGAIRLSWCHLTPMPPWREMAKIIRTLQ
jgi:cysteine desulfurase